MEVRGRKGGVEAPGSRICLGSLGPVESVLVALSLLAACILIVDPIVMVAVRDLEEGPRQFFRAFTDLAKARWPVLFAAVVLLMLYLFGPQASSRKGEAARRHAGHMIGFLAAAVALTGVAVSLIKNVIGRARPKLFEELGPAAFQPFSFDYDYASFPSGHATSIFTVAAVAAIFWPRARVYILIAAAWIAATRFLIGSHYLSDVVAGALFGLSATYLLRDRLAERRLLFRRNGSGDVELKGRRTLAWGRDRLKTAILVKTGH